MTLPLFGLGFRPQHYRLITDSRPRSVDWFELISENFMISGGRPLHFMNALRMTYPVATHGVGLSIGSHEPLLPAYLKALKTHVERVEPFIVSDHLCFVTSRGRTSHDLLPIAYSQKNLQTILDKVDQVQTLLKRPLLLENPSAYVSLEGSEMPEAEFLAELSLRSGCQVLLDLNNVYVNANNLGVDPERYLASLPQDSVRQFHLAGHSKDPSGMLIDTHDAPVCEEVWALFRVAAKRWPTVPVLVEWDAQIPEFARLEAELERARSEHALAQLPLTQPPRVRQTTCPELRLEKGPEPLFFDRVTHPTSGNPSHGLSIYQNAYYARIREVMIELFPKLYEVMEDEGWDHVLSAYLRFSPPSHFSITQVGRGFAPFLKKGTFDFDFGVEAALLSELALLEWTHVELFEREDSADVATLESLQRITAAQWPEAKFELSNQIKILRLHWNLLELGANPPQPEECWILLSRDDGNITQSRLNREAALGLSRLKEGATFGELATHFSSPSEAAKALAIWVNKGWIAEPRVSKAATPEPPASFAYPQSAQTPLP